MAKQRRSYTREFKVEAIHREVKARYGSPRIHAELVARGVPCCVNTVAKLMRDRGIAARTKRKLRCTTDSDHGRPVAENILDRQFRPGRLTVVLPTKEGQTLRLRCVVRPDRAQAILLHHLGLELPQRLRLSKGITNM